MSAPTRFADLADGGRALAPLVARALGGTVPLVLGVQPYGLPVAQVVAAALGTPALALPVTRDEAGVRPTLPGAVTGRLVVVVDDGVETGTAARAVGAALRAAGAGRTMLAVPVCPREAEAALAQVYDEVVAVVRPLVRRSLRWHYDRLDR